MQKKTNYQHAFDPIISTMLINGKCSFSTMLRFGFQRFEPLFPRNLSSMHKRNTVYNIKYGVSIYILFSHLSAPVLIIWNSQNVGAKYQHHMFNHNITITSIYFFQISLIKYLRYQRNQKFQYKISKISKIV